MSEINHIQEFYIKTYVQGSPLKEEHIKHAIRHYVNDTAEVDLTLLERVKVTEKKR